VVGKSSQPTPHPTPPPQSPKPHLLIVVALFIGTLSREGGREKREVRELAGRLDIVGFDLVCFRRGDLSFAGD